MKFAEVGSRTGPTPPPDTLLVPPSAFHPQWQHAPATPVCIGITPLSEGDKEEAKSRAASEAYAMFRRPEQDAERLEVMQDILLRWVVARGTTDPNDVTQPFELFAEGAEDIVKLALTAEGARAIYDAVERVTIVLDPCLDEMDDDSIAGLWAIGSVCLAKMPTSNANRIRRLLTYCMNEMIPFV